MFALCMFVHVFYCVFRGHSTGQKSPLTVPRRWKALEQAAFLLPHQSACSLVVFELQLLWDSWKWMWSCLKRIKRRPWLCWARGQHRCYGGNDLACHHTYVSALTFTEVTELLSAFCRGLISLLHVNEELDFLKSEEGIREAWLAQQGFCWGKLISWPCLRVINKFLTGFFFTRVHLHDKASNWESIAEWWD